MFRESLPGSMHLRQQLQLQGRPPTSRTATTARTSYLTPIKRSHVAVPAAADEDAQPSAGSSAAAAASPPEGAQDVIAILEQTLEGVDSVTESVPSRIQNDGGGHRGEGASTGSAKHKARPYIVQALQAACGCCASHTCDCII